MANGTLNLLLATWGSMGDLQPFVALAEQFVRRGHRPRLGGPSFFAQPVQSRGLPFAPIGPAHTADRYAELMTRLIRENNPRQQLKTIQTEVIGDALPQQYDDTLSVLQRHPVDLVVCHWMALGSMMAAETLGIPVATVCLNAIGLECVHGDAWGLQGQIDKLRARRIGEQMADSLWGDTVSSFRASRKLPALESVSAYQYGWPVNIVAVSPQLLSGHADWDAQHKLTGYFLPDISSAWLPDPELAQFMAEGEPLVFCFGSMPNADPEGTTRILVDCAERLGKKAVLQMGWGGIASTRGLPSSIRMVTHTPHAWLFKHASCIIHHGGAGTCAAALSAGVPSVVVPHMLDQFSWAASLTSLGLSPGSVSFAQLSVESLTPLIDQALGQAHFRKSCQAIQERMSRDGGASLAAQILEEFALRSTTLSIPMPHITPSNNNRLTPHLSNI